MNSKENSKALQGKIASGATSQDKAVDAAVAQFMKSIDHAARRELEKTVRKAFADGKLKPGDTFTAGMGVKSAELDLDVTVFGKIEV